MEDGQLNKFKVGAIIQARLGSSRLPGKVLLPLPYNNGKPLLQWIVDEVKNSKIINDQTIATSINKENFKIEKFFEEFIDINIFRGSEKNVLSRFIAVTKAQKYDVVVRLTADNPFIDINLLDQVIQYHINKRSDYTRTTGLPAGMNFEIISSEALLSLENKNLSESDKEHVTMAFKKYDSYLKNIFDIKIPRSLKKLRLTIDYPSDFALASLLLSLKKETEKPNVKFIRRVYNSIPWLFEINDSNIQKKYFQRVEEEIIYAKQVLTKLGMDNAVERL
ncbi:cytidylyltransferase domain-containing protein [Fodinibius sediminis]|uniref:Spore coat polysaccharide biosynthesis protein SpsF n=1 Tax=Fodinibius sediminis TaxID=1214077 RepID=A0A521EWK6_9BACT|nr:hypothetical protein [Fodinibius sediminis]SMO87791.1 spore coat polysaccharide biosynthesis protein SpsF [Fodinibius sediminis]